VTHQPTSTKSEISNVYNYKKYDPIGTASYKQEPIKTYEFEKPKPNYKIEKVEREYQFNIQDDDDGHLIYVPGDLLKKRCKFFIFFSNF
jgi:hypothetical protein